MINPARHQLYVYSSLALTISSLIYAYQHTDGSLEGLIHFSLSYKISLLFHINSSYLLLMLLGHTIIDLFLGNIREEEMRILKDKMIMFCILNALFIFYVLSPNDLSEAVSCISWFSCIGVVKSCFIVLRERIKFIINTIGSEDRIHRKLVALIFTVLILNGLLTCFGYVNFNHSGVRMTLLLLFECWVIFLEALQMIIEYSIFLYELNYDQLHVDKEDFFFYFTFVMVNLLAVYDDKSNFQSLKEKCVTVYRIFDAVENFE
jgi:hypothetical protein